MQYLFGVDIGGTTVKIGLVSYEGELLDCFEIKTDRSNQGVNILPDIRDAIYEYIDSHNISKSDIYGIGFGVPGPVANNVVKECVNLGWPFVNVRDEFLKLLDFEPVIACGNDANVAALGEMSVCGDSTYSSSVMFTLGTGVGGGIILNNKIVDGFNGGAGELGHLHLDNVHNYRCSCGLFGCLETVASATGVVRLAKEYLHSIPSVLNDLPDEKLTSKAIFDAAKQNDELALKVVDELAYYIGNAASVVACVVDPDIFIIGGGVSKAGDILIEAITKHYKKLVFKPMRNTPFTLAKLGNNAGMLGAALLTKK